MQKIIVNFNDENKRLDNFLLKYFSTLNRSIIFKLIRTNKIKVNGEKKQFDYRLKVNDEIVIFYELNEENKNGNNKPNFLLSKKKIDIIYEDENIAIINKPIGIQSQPSTTPFKENIQDMFLKYLYDKNEYNYENENIFVPSICHRLDTNTSGLLIAAKNLRSINSILELIKERKIIKLYKCLVIGDVKPNENTLVAYLKKNENNNLVHITPQKKNGYKEIITKYKKISFNGKYSLLDIELVTGRTHQIRAHLNFIGYPLVGENKYKKKDTNADKRYKHQALVSYSINFKIDDKNNHLHYLNNKTFTLSDIWFMNKKF